VTISVLVTGTCHCLQLDLGLTNGQPMRQACTRDPGPVANSDSSGFHSPKVTGLCHWGRSLRASRAGEPQCRGWSRPGCGWRRGRPRSPHLQVLPWHRPAVWEAGERQRSYLKAHWLALGMSYRWKSDL
jgi:hypothetical protein